MRLARFSLIILSLRVVVPDGLHGIQIARLFTRACKRSSRIIYLLCLTVQISWPAKIPSGTAIPAWAYIDVTVTDALNVTEAQSIAAERLPESTAGSAPSSTPPLVTFSSSGSGASPTSQGTPAPSAGAGGAPSGDDSSSSNKSSNTGAIVGGVVGGIGGAAILAGIIAWLAIRNKRQRGAAPLAGHSPGGSAPGTYNANPPMTAVSSGSPLTMSPPPQSAYSQENPFNYPSTQQSYANLNPSVPSSPAPYGSPQHAQPAYQPGRYTGVPEV